MDRVVLVLDRSSLVAALIGASYLGLLACDIDLTSWLSPHARALVFGMVGLSAMWQWKRQRF
ncbi:MAG: hypothetical protein JO032_15695 [Alphaproteobacteria bacterium]|nr:hypothetical protein [Alphaproteobacteria bacterium]MBV9554222.1 hypothetical protein [Alphaproteobacteria bacterium]